MKKELYTKLADGTEISRYTIENANGMKVSFLDWGGVIESLIVKDKNGVERDVVLGFPTFENGYDKNTVDFGANVGRCCNRIAGASFELNGKTYTMDKNEGENNLHSGFDFWFTRMWNVESEPQEDGENITFFGSSPAGDQGFPGNMDVEMSFTLTNQNELFCEFYGYTDEDTLFNMTNHSYFNLNGHDSGDVRGHKLTMKVDGWTPTNDKLIVTGEVAPVDGTPLDFRTEKTIGQDIDSDYQPLIYGGGGYDQNFVINGGKVVEDAELVAKVVGDQSGIVMELYTDRPCLQLYTQNYDAERTVPGKNGAVYRSHSGLCLEPQFAPDAIHHAEFESPVLKAGQEATALTVYRFYTEG